jgi:hypothetical protein
VNIAILAYGSLVWDEECLAPHIHGGWRLGEGPRLPVEFCRISPKRKRALVLTIDPEQGHEVATSYTLSRRDDVAEAVADLAARERCDARFIGICHRQRRGPTPDSPLHARIHAWLQRHQGIDAAIWAALPVNFHAETGRPFSHETAVAYLQTLTGDALKEAWRYITFAPAETDTPLRRFLARHHWWSALDFRK